MHLFWKWLDLLNISPIVKLSSVFWEGVNKISKLKKKTPQITPLLYQTVPSMGRFFHPCECFEFVQPESDRNCWNMKPYFCNWCSAAWELNQTTTSVLSSRGVVEIVSEHPNDSRQESCWRDHRRGVFPLKNRFLSLAPPTAPAHQLQKSTIEGIAYFHLQLNSALE